jgi:hypothetical protein
MTVDAQKGFAYHSVKLVLTVTGMRLIPFRFLKVVKPSIHLVVIVLYY